MWRVATSEHFKDTLSDIEKNWSLNDLYDAHDVIDMLEELKRRQEKASRRK